ncbi:hypothetical protein Dgeo_2784 (plasmid) [Deinococcus geothermalis DSM 11300]|uniref:Uncharacterized protein n=1 Tax=Deinococcus geothermalis (strain DSM 11300 / CIP 105573 / AG-3a) TaxID=319795 RepID=Q1J2R8_DEIGD|nr:hypothetical protein Dgeo_2784 [Deinococcus geothermalis DSM 11300]
MVGLVVDIAGISTAFLGEQTRSFSAPFLPPPSRQVVSQRCFLLGIGLPSHHISSALPAHPCCVQLVAQGGSADRDAVLLSDVLAQRS